MISRRSRLSVGLDDDATCPVTALADLLPVDATCVAALEDWRLALRTPRMSVLGLHSDALLAYVRAHASTSCNMKIGLRRNIGSHGSFWHEHALLIPAWGSHLISIICPPP